MDLDVDRFEINTLYSADPLSSRLGAKLSTEITQEVPITALGIYWRTKNDVALRTARFAVNLVRLLLFIAGEINCGLRFLGRIKELKYRYQKRSSETKS